jgi:Protein of unknown function (DUF2911)
MKAGFFFTLLISVTIAVTGQAQTGKLPILDKSPVDISYHPANFPVLKIQDKISEPLVARVVYSRPQKNDRVIFGELVEYGKVWRLGANEATEIEFYKEVKIGGKKVAKGRYTLYALVNKNSWTMIVNKETDVWGAFKYDSKKDIVRTDVPVVANTEVAEAVAMAFEKTTAGMNLIIAWDDVKVVLPISYK